MALLNNNNLDYEIKTDGDFAEILRYFDGDFINSVVNETIDKRFRAFVQSVPNIVNSLDLKFKNSCIEFPDKVEEINILRDATYRNIIFMIANRFNLSINTEIEFDPYTLAVYMYDFFVSKFTQNMVYFFSSFLLREKNSIYDSLNLIEFKKSKDSSTLHAKKLYNDSKLIAIMGNLGYVLKNISSIDISLNDIFMKILPLPEPATFISNAVLDNGNFFKDFYCCYSDENNEFNPTFITAININLQQSLMSQANTIQMGDN